MSETEVERHEIYGTLTDDEFLEIAEILGKSFKDPKKGVMWIMTPNPMLGGMIPAWLVLSGRGRKLLSYMRDWSSGDIMLP